MDRYFLQGIAELVSLTTPQSLFDAILDLPRDDIEQHNRLHIQGNIDFDRGISCESSTNRPSTQRQLHDPQARNTASQCEPLDQPSQCEIGPQTPVLNVNDSVDLCCF